MKCKELRDRFDDFILGEVDPALEIRINEHILECPQCRAEVREKEEVKDRLAAGPAKQPPVDAYRRIRERVFLPGRTRRPFWAAWTVRVAAVSAAFLFGMVLMRMADMAALRSRAARGVETRGRTYNRVPYSDTVQFYAAPAKNLAKI